MSRVQPQFSSGGAKQLLLGKYVIAAVIGAFLAYLAGSFFAPATTLALPEPGSVCAKGVLAVPAQLSSQAYGLYLIDLNNQIILLYSYSHARTRAPGLLRLMSARSFRYDRQLIDFNCAKPSPQDIQQLIEAGSKTLPYTGESDEGSTAPAIAEPTSDPEQ